jgi:hypothetical protein
MRIFETIDDIAITEELIENGFKLTRGSMSSNMNPDISIYIYRVDAGQIGSLDGNKWKFKYSEIESTLFHIIKFLDSENYKLYSTPCGNFHVGDDFELSLDKKIKALKQIMDEKDRSVNQQQVSFCFKYVPLN